MGTVLASGGDDGLVCRWNGDAAAEVGTPITAHAGWIPSLTAFHMILQQQPGQLRRCRRVQELHQCLEVLRRRREARAQGVHGSPHQPVLPAGKPGQKPPGTDRKSTRLNSSHITISYAVFCLKKK